MDGLSNAFSLLELDVEDNKEETTSSAQNTEKANDGDYKLPLVWIDLEMTGLNIEVDRILEIARVITDGKLTKSVEGPDLIIHQTKECLNKMGEWCQKHHAESGLTEKVIQSTISEKEAEQKVVEFVKTHVGTYTPLLAGNSIYVDFMFLKKYMPDLASLFSHVVVDVSSFKALCMRWFPKVLKPKVTQVKDHDFIRNRFVGIGKGSAIRGWLHSFFKQFYGSVTKSDYVASVTITTHCKGSSIFTST